MKVCTLYYLYKIFIRLMKLHSSIIFFKTFLTLVKEAAPNTKYDIIPMPGQNGKNG